MPTELANPDQSRRWLIFGVLALALRHERDSRREHVGGRALDQRHPGLGRSGLTTVVALLRVPASIGYSVLFGLVAAEPAGAVVPQ